MLSSSKTARLYREAHHYINLLQCDAATLKIYNQKNGKMEQTIEATGDDESCPVQALAYRVHHILSNGGNGAILLYSYKTKKHNHFN